MLAVTFVASCHGRTNERPRAEQAAVAFYDAITQQNGAAACALLAPETLQDIEKSAKQPCDQAIADEDLPDQLGKVSDTAVHGNEATIVAAGDTVFVSDFDGVWKIVAVGCTAQGDLPYDCEIKGG
jgi:hypothetical protein